MTNKGTIARMGCLFTLVLLSLCAGFVNAQSVVWLTSPSEQRGLSFVRQGLVKEVFVKEGDMVKAGQLLMRLDDSVEVEKFKTLELLANDDVRVRYARAVRDQAAVDLEKYENLAKKGNANSYEVEHARLEVTKTQASLDIAELELKQAIGNRDEMKASIAQMHLLSPIAGRVEQLARREGEGVDAQERILLVASIDPLWVDVPVSFDLAEKVEEGDKVAVKFLNGYGGDYSLTQPLNDDADVNAPVDAIEAKVIFKATLADAAGKINVRVELPNPDRIPAHGRVKIWFGDAAKPKGELETQTKETQK